MKSLVNSVVDIYIIAMPFKSLNMLITTTNNRGVFILTEDLLLLLLLFCCYFLNGVKAV